MFRFSFSFSFCNIDIILFMCTFMLCICTVNRSVTIALKIHTFLDTSDPIFSMIFIMMIESNISMALLKALVKVKSRFITWSLAGQVANAKPLGPILISTVPTYAAFLHNASYFQSLHHLPLSSVVIISKGEEFLELSRPWRVGQPRSLTNEH